MPHLLDNQNTSMFHLHYLLSLLKPIHNYRRKKHRCQAKKSTSLKQHLSLILLWPGVYLCSFANISFMEFISHAFYLLWKDNIALPAGQSILFRGLVRKFAWQIFLKSSIYRDTLMWP